MPKNRDYTGLERTPSSMAWLIRQRSILRGKLEKLKALQATLPESIQSLETDLASLDAVIPLHEVKVDPTVIRGRRPHRPAIADYGVVNRTLLQRLREANGSPLYTNELAMEVARVIGLEATQQQMTDLMDRVGRRLRSLAEKGMVKRHHSNGARVMGRWSLVMDDDQGASVDS